MNCGHHAASHNHYGFQHYKKTVSNMLRGIEEDDLVNKKRYYWVESVAIPLHEDENVVKYKDWRTYHRLHLFNSLAEDVIRATKNLSIASVPAFQSSMAIFDKVLLLNISKKRALCLIVCYFDNFF